ncbi:hypothetical protein GCM10011613_23030 [Cellvibrio zantedeschiae]|uniref:DUF2141 domain-containing protein n=1 Tax=Cellvibrio zantedeschiae TaxID=1237077 RepID=A0ABQ3B4A2_9GAMM|nr:DUF2141 domain-containing protein [Cellvibrio zantedeschiae]GGY77839.1 hypothetical protein GCM10011613_23030 [Cellvibrio zantedeschiae]
MNKPKLFIASASLMALLVSTNLSAAELIVEVENIQDIKGTLYFSLYKDEKGFNANENFVARQRVSVDKKTVQVNFGDVPAGEYAVKAYQDVNDNGKMDFNGAMPAEPYGTSSKSKEIAPPSFTSAKFTLDKNQKVQVNLLK